MKTDIDLKPVIELTINLNGNVNPKGLTIRAIRKTKEHGLIIETPFSDEKEAIKYAKEKLQNLKKKRIYNYKFEIL